MRRDQAHQHLLIAARRVSPTLEDVLAAAGPLWFPRRRTTDLALHLCRAVVGQQLSGAAARTIWGRLQGTLGGGRDLPDRCRPDATPRMRASGVSAAKARALIEIREARVSGLLDDALAVGERDARDALLRQIRGVGQWTCDMVSIFFCKDPDVWPTGDVSVQRAFRTALGEAAGEADRHQAAFAPWRSILVLHMYRYLDAPTDADQPR
jgi:DNA-3-methyladenine glycosylase II